MKLGDKIRNLRKERNISIEQLSNLSGLSMGMISQMERNKSVPSVETLWAVSKGLDVHINYFFDEYETEDPIVRKDGRKKILLPKSNITYELLSPNVNKKMELLLITIDPGKSGEEQNAHEGEECGYVLQGTLKIKWGSREYILNEGDSIYYESCVPHRLYNIGSVTCKSLWTMSPPSY